MYWLKRDIWKAGIAFTGLLLLLVLMVWVPVTAGAYEGASGLATSVTGTVQATPTANSTIAAETANEQLRKLQLDNDRSLNAWVWNNGATILSSFLSTLVIVSGALIGFRQWRGNQRAERDKQAEGRFQSAVTGLGDEKEGAKIGAAIVLRTFLRPGYEQFYTQTFDLAVAHLRLRRTPHPLEGSDATLPLTPLSQALIMVFKEAFPRARNLYPRGHQPLVARGIRLDSAYLEEADLKQVWMPQASLREADLSLADLSLADLSLADLSGAILKEADLSGVNLKRAMLSGANLYKANLSGASLDDTKLNMAMLSEANLSKATFSGAILHGANFDRADLHEANLSGAFFSRNILCGADLRMANLSGVNLNGADLTGADLTGANLLWTALDGADLRGASLNEVSPENAQSFRNANLRGVKGLTKAQLTICKAKGAIIDENPTTSSSQPTLAPPPSLQSNEAQAQSAPSAQISSPTPDLGPKNILSNGSTAEDD